MNRVSTKPGAVQLALLWSGLVDFSATVEGTPQPHPHPPQPD